ncbi:hypothetical protein [Ovoidimarina sediminis]|uniref:hypothetical protein n=1 Tax=Ovoidimarina sediminis TaxID=3079856 RepID=UPI0029082A69|nr:hypothetical protein [Rhodophyticola sp. MJ-SS7]MDU8944859.1 hypothetical protein [Rhodophyticola sp. MJ-SS7]
MTTLSASADLAPARLRIAIPAWRIGARRTAEVEGPVAPGIADFKELLDTALDPTDLTELRLTRSERRQLALARRLRRALYDAPRCA